jgi:hypothetical protein
VDETRLHEALLRHYRLRVDTQTMRYILQRLPEGNKFPVLGGDAMTGIPQRVTLDPSLLNLNDRTLNP